MTATRSDIENASSWSWVTYTNVMPTRAAASLSCRLQLLAQLQVERAQRLVEQQHLRVLDQRPRQRDALLLAARELRAAAARSRPLSCTSSSISRDPARISALRPPLLAQAEGDVLEPSRCGNSA